MSEQERRPSILREQNGRYLQYIYCDPSTMRYEIRERRGEGAAPADALIFWTHSLSVALMHWERISQISVKRKKTPWIEW